MAPLGQLVFAASPTHALRALPLFSAPSRGEGLGKCQPNGYGPRCVQVREAPTKKHLKPELLPFGDDSLTIPCLEPSFTG